MADFSLPAYSAIEDIGTASATTAAGNTKTGWSQIIASTARNYEGLLITMCKADTAQKYLIDIAVGAASSEQVIVPNIFYEPKIDYGGASEFFLPLHVPAGSRLAMRLQAGGSSGKTAYVNVKGAVAGHTSMRGYAAATNYGADTSNSDGVTVDPGGTANTKGSWVALTSSCLETRALLLNVGPDSNSTNVYAAWKIDVAVGASGSEQIIVANLHGEQRNTSAVVYSPQQHMLPIAIPAGSRIAVRCECTTSETPGRELSVNAIGVS